MTHGKIEEIEAETSNDLYKDIEKAFTFNEYYQEALEDGNDAEKRFLIR